MLSGMFREYVNLAGSVFLLFLIFYALERLAPAEKGQPAAKWLFNFVYMPFILALLTLLLIPFNVFYSVVLRFIGGGLLPQFIDQPGSLAAHLLFAVCFALVWDLWQYWMHRLQHTVPFLWQTHKFHHGETALNCGTQARNHILSYVLLLVCYLPVLVLFGSRAPHFIAGFVMFRLWGFFNHMNVRLNLGPLTTIFSGPQWHRIHHSIDTKHRRKNFAAFFPFIDILFGTYYSPHKEEYPATGLPAKDITPDFREATVAPFVAWYKMATK